MILVKLLSQPNLTLSVAALDLFKQRRVLTAIEYYIIYHSLEYETETFGKQVVHIRIKGGATITTHSIGIAIDVDLPSPPVPKIITVPYVPPRIQEPIENIEPIDVALFYPTMYSMWILVKLWRGSSQCISLTTQNPTLRKIANYIYKKEQLSADVVDGSYYVYHVFSNDKIPLSSLIGRIVCVEGWKESKSIQPIVYVYGRIKNDIAEYKPWKTKISKIISVQDDELYVSDVA
jgi:hypothetical protein